MVKFDDGNLTVDAMFGIGINIISTMVVEIWRMLSQLTRRMSFATCENVRETTF